MIGAGGRQFADRGDAGRVLLLALPDGMVRAEPLPALDGAGPGAGTRARRRAGVPGPAGRRDAAGPPAAVVPPDPDPDPGLAPASPDAAPAPEAAGGGRLPPALATGQLWVRPLPAAPRELARRLKRTNEELADSVVTAAVQAFLDSVAHEPGAADIALPDWTTEIGGRKFGIDDRYIYVAGLKIPSVLLALLPLPGGGNYDQNRAYNHLMDIRRDIYQAAARADNAAEFKRYVKEIRERKEQERRFREAQRTPPDSTAAPRVP